MIKIIKMLILAMVCMALISWACLILVSCSTLGSPLASYHGVILDNRTAIDFVLIVDDSTWGKLEAGETTKILLKEGSTRMIQLRYTEPYLGSHGKLHIISFPIDDGVKRVIIGMSDGEVKISFETIRK